MTIVNHPDIKHFIRERSNLFWYIPANKKEEISHELLVETIFNYGDLNDVRQLIMIMGIEQLSDIFSGIKGRKKLNYYPEMYHFYSVLINKYVHSDI